MALEGELAGGGAAGGGAAVVTVGGEQFDGTRDMLHFVKGSKKVSGRNYHPQVIEPSYGIGRIMYSVLEHCYWVRPSDDSDARSVLLCGRYTVITITNCNNYN